MRLHKEEPKKEGFKFGKVGSVSIGDKALSKSGKEYPISIDYFRFKSDFKKHVEDAIKAYGERPNHLDIMFYSDDVDECCSHRMELRDKGGRMVAYGDGKVFYRSTEKQGFVRETVEQYPTYIESLSRKIGQEWQEVLILRFLLVNTPNIGYWEFRTKAGETTIPQIVDTFDSCISQWGTASRIPFSLLVKKHKSNRANVNRQYPVVSLILNLSVDALEKIKSIGHTIQGVLTEEKLLNASPVPELDSGIQDAEIIE